MGGRAASAYSATRRRPARAASRSTAATGDATVSSTPRSWCASASSTRASRAPGTRRSRRAASATPSGTTIIAANDTATTRAAASPTRGVGPARATAPARTVAHGVHQRAVVRNIDRDATRHSSRVCSVPKIAYRRSACYAQLGEGDRNRGILRPAVEQGDGLASARQILRPHLGAARSRDLLSTGAQGILIDRKHLLVREQSESPAVGAELGHLAAEHERRRHDCP